jgi:hypothetical protein
VDGGVSEVGQFQIITLNRGARDGIEVGHVLASYRRGGYAGRGDRRSFDGPGEGLEVKPVPVVPDPPVAQSADPKGPVDSARSVVKLPDERNGLVFVFRVFDKLSYAMVMRATRPIAIGDFVRTP